MAKEKTRGKQPNRWQKLLAALRRRLQSLLILAAAFVLIYVVGLAVIMPARYDLQVGDIAKTTITASKEVEDEVTTQQRRDAAAAQVQPVYYREEAVDAEVLAALESAITELERVQAYGSASRQAWAQANGEEPANAPRGADSYTEEQLTEAAALLSQVKLNQTQLISLLDATEAEIDNLHQNLLSGVKTTLNGTIPEGQTSTAINNIQQLVGYTMRSELWANVAVPVLRASLRPNMVIDQVATEENRQKARDEVEPVVFMQGQNIVVSGEQVTAAQIALLRSLGLLEGNQFDNLLYLGVGLLSLLLLLLIVVYLRLFARKMLSDVKMQLLMLTIFGLTLLFCLLANLVDAYAVPTALGVLLATVLLGAPVAMGMTLVEALLMSMFSLRVSSALAGQALAVVFISILGGVVGILIVRKRATRSTVLLGGLLIGLVNLLGTLAVGMITNNSFMLVFRHGLYAFAGGILAAVLCVGLQPLLESMFSLVTASKLLELSNPNNPLLRRLMMEAPGTYHHSMIVANLAEGAAEAIGANSLLARVGSYFHDIGKLKRPMYFKENQMGENPHDHTDPFVSKEILRAHVTDGLDLGQRHHLPQPVLDIIAQHHGDTPTLYFYYKAQQVYPDREINIDDFRYPGPRPQSAEAVLVMLADTIEAAVRSLPDPTPEKLRDTVRKLIRDKVQDDQMSDAPVTYRNITQITDSFVNVLGGVFHERIEYPPVELPPLRKLPPPEPVASGVPVIQTMPQQPVVLLDEEGKPPPAPLKHVVRPAAGNSPTQEIPTIDVDDV